MKRESMLMEADELLKKLDDRNIRIFDATVTDTFYLQGHIPGSAFFDHQRFSDPASAYEHTLLPDAELAAQIGNIGISEESQVVFYACGMLPYAARAWWLLRYAGHRNVYVLNGGLTAWKKASGKIEQEVRHYEPSIYQAQFELDMYVSKEEVRASIEAEEVITVNVLPLGSHEASHIIGSTCLPCLDVMQEMDYFLPDEKLAARLKEVPHDKRIITYCGGGIAATVNGMAHMMTGHENVAVYNGSMIEWESERLPVAGTGKWAVWEKS